MSPNIFSILCLILWLLHSAELSKLVKVFLSLSDFYSARPRPTQLYPFQVWSRFNSLSTSQRDDSKAKMIIPLFLSQRKLQFSWLRRYKNNCSNNIYLPRYTIVVFTTVNMINYNGNKKKENYIYLMYITWNFLQSFFNFKLITQTKQYFN